MAEIENIFRDSSTGLSGELVDTILRGGKIDRLERAISPESGNPSRVYDQEEDEFVMVVRGYAEVEFEENGRKEIKKMVDGDYTTIPAHLKHRVVKTDEGTTWLALFYKK